jgi:hypothetical protein
MPFIAECPYCKKGKIRAPETAVGWSAACPNPDCGSFFTLMPQSKEEAAAAAAAPAQPAAATPAVKNAAATEPSLAAATAGTALQEETAAETAARQPIMRRPMPPPPPQRRARNPFAVFALFLGSLGLLCASFPIVEPAALPLAGLGLVLGLIGILYAIGKEIGIGLAGISSLVCATTLVVITCIPSLIDFRRGMTETTPIDPNRRTVAPLSSGGGPAREVSESEWTDASSGVLQLGDTWIRVTSASVEHIGLQTQGQQRTLSPGKFLVLRLQLANNGATRRIDYQTWAHTRQGPSKHLVRLADQNGKTVPQASFLGGVEPVGQVQTGFMYPGKSLDDFLIFEVPSGKIEHLHLELGASAFGGQGKLQFQVPRSMIKTK